MKIVIFGAGSIGTYIGASLLAAGGDVLLIGRTKMAERIARHGVHLTDVRGGSIKLEGSKVPYTEDPGALSEGDLILVTVKSSDTATVANAIYTYAKPAALVLSLQNGVGNANTLREQLVGWRVLGGMVPFNVVQRTGGRFHCGNGGELMIEASPAIAPWKDLFQAARLPLTERRDFAEVQWGKLLLSLNNAVNALSGIPIKAELRQHAYRRCLALLIEEALEVMRAAGIRPARVTRVPPRLLSMLLRLPDAMFKRIAGAMLRRIDSYARSSIWEDLEAGRRTEIDYLNGAVVMLAMSMGRKAPANLRIVELIHAAHRGRKITCNGDMLYALLTAPSAVSTHSTLLPQKLRDAP